MSIKQYTLLGLSALFFSGLQAQLNVVTSPNVTICQPQPVTLTASAPAVPSTTAYSIMSIPWAPETIGGTVVSLSDDAATGALSIGFTFCFLGQSYTQFYIGSNGWISFSPGQPATYTSAPIPSTIASVPKNCIMGPWQDWHPGIAPGNFIKYQTIGTAPFRKLVVTYDNIPMYSCTSTLGRFQIVCHETTNIIENHLYNKPFCSWAGGTATQGIHNAAGTIAYVTPGRNSSVWTAVNESWRFSPSGPSGNIVWTVGGQTVGTGTSISVLPSQTTTYTASLEQCGSQVTPGQVTVTIEPSPVQGNPIITPTSCTEAIGNITVSLNPNFTDPVQFQWNDPNNTVGPGLVNIPSGQYSVQVTNLASGCTFTQTFNPVFPQPIQLNLSSQNESCTGLNNGQVSVAATGGSTPLQIFWEELEVSQPTVSGVGPGTYNVTVVDQFNCQATGSVDVNTLVNLILEPYALNISCAGQADGQAGVNVTGGQPNYTFQWSDPQGQTTQIAAGLSEGEYTVVVSEASGCTGTATIQVTEPDLLIASVASVQDALCFGQSTGQASITVSGGTGQLSYVYNGQALSNPATTLAAGDYSVVVSDANGCSSNLQVSIGQPSQLTVTATGTNPLCFGATTGSASASANGGVGGYTYSWTNSTSTSATATSLPSGSYTVTVLDGNGCSANASVNLTQPPALVAQIQSTPATCGLSDGTASASASGGTGAYTFNWPAISQQGASAQNLAAGSYQVVVTDANGCVGNSTVVISETDFPDAVIIPSETTGYAPLEITFQNESSNASSYEWDFGDGQIITTTGNNSVSHVFTANSEFQEYQVIVTATNDGGCTDQFAMIIQVFGLSSIETYNVFSPNGDGINEIFTFTTRSMRDLECTIFNRWGKEVHSWKGVDGGWDGSAPNGDDCPSGTYYYIVKATGFDGKNYDLEGNVTLLRQK